MAARQGPTGNACLLAAEVDRPRDFALQVRAAHDAVNEAMLQEEFAGLESLGQFDANRGLNHARAGKTDQGTWLGEDHIPQRGKAGRHAPPMVGFVSTEMYSPPAAS